MTIRNPVEWGVDQFKHAALAFESAGRAGRRTRENLHSPLPAIRRISVADLGDVLARGLDDFGAYRTDVIFLCVIYPLVGLLLARLAFGYEMLPLVFPLASGFALVGPLAAVGLYEMSRRRRPLEQASNNLAHLLLFGLSCSQTRRYRWKSPCGNQHSAALNKFLELAQRLERDAVDARQDDHTIFIRSQYQGVFLNATDVAEGGVIEEIKIVTGFQSPGNDIRPHEIAQGVDHVDVPGRKVGPGVVVWKIECHVVGRLTLS